MCMWNVDAKLVNTKIHEKIWVLLTGFHSMCNFLEDDLCMIDILTTLFVRIYNSLMYQIWLFLLLETCDFWYKQLITIKNIQ